ncbi:MAG: hypothetical protein IT435_00735 [Phycisphaerales bacterium]|nr:hypothetical protein [Phycisphaerales bacterium]
MPQQYDWLIVTAASRAQAQGYEAQLGSRRAAGVLDAFGRVLVVPDPGDRRVGSGGSTLAALTEVVRRRAREAQRGSSGAIADLLAGQRILIIHSGGDSRRLPAYAAQGKVFAPLPCDTEWGRQADLFDLVLQDSMTVRLPDVGGVLITAGDALLGLSRHRDAISAGLRGDGLEGRAGGVGVGGFVGVAFPTDPQRGARHGVYVLDEVGRVVDFLQKPSIERQREMGALDAQGRTLVDTGIVYADPRTAAQWLEGVGLELSPRGPVMSGLLAGIIGGGALAIDLYHHVLAALPSRTGIAEYLGQFIAGEDHRQMLRNLYSVLHGMPLRAVVMPDCDFLHIGSTREMIGLVTADARVRRPRVGVGGVGVGAGQVCIYNSPRMPGGAGEGPGTGAGTPQAKRVRGEAGKGRKLRAVVEACDVTRLSLGGENIVVGLPRELEGRVHLPYGWGLAALPIGKQDWACILFGDGDDCKTPIDRGGTLGNRPLAELLHRGCADGDVWGRRGGGERSLWTARLWGIGSASEAFDAVAWLMDENREAPGSWTRMRRMSLADLLLAVNHGRLIEHRSALLRIDRLARLGERIKGDSWLPASEIAADCRTPAERRAAIRVVAEAIERADPIGKARLHTLAAELGSGAAASRERARAFSAVADAVRMDFKLPSVSPRLGVLPDQVVWVTTPVRIDLAGGWSDTPPICHEVGGSVVNMAITLNGQFPVQVIARRAEAPVIRLSSVDLGKTVSFSTSRAVCEYRDPHDWAALPKAALVLSGIAPSDGSVSLSRWLERFGGGLELTVFSALPKGSGLGTSSVLGAAILACLDRVVGREKIDHASIIHRTSLLEQMMSTAGGWQDQAGGITPGIKINRTSAGKNQIPAITPIPLVQRMADELGERSLLYYTGYRRLARDILQNVVSRYLSRDREAVRTIHELKALAERMHAALLAADVAAFAACVRQNWEFKKRLDPGSTNARIEGILRPIEKFLSGYEMPGAGGGGFLYLIAKDAAAANRVRSALERRRTNRLARFFDVEVDGRGLAVSVL